MTPRPMDLLVIICDVSKYIRLFMQSKYSYIFDDCQISIRSKVLRDTIWSRRDETGIISRLGGETRVISRTGMGIETSRDFRESRTFRDVSNFSRFFGFESESSIY